MQTSRENDFPGWGDASRSKKGQNVDWGTMNQADDKQCWKSGSVPKDNTEYKSPPSLSLKTSKKTIILDNSPSPIVSNKSSRELDWQQNARFCFANEEDPEGNDLDELSFPKWAMTGPGKEERQIISKMIIEACAQSFYDWKSHESYIDKNAKSECDSESSGDMMYVHKSDGILDNASPPLLEKNNNQSQEQVAKFGHALSRCPPFLFAVCRKNMGHN